MALRHRHKKRNPHLYPIWVPDRVAKNNFPPVTSKPQIKMQNQDLPIMDRIKAPTPKLFAIIRNIGITLATVAGAVMGLQEQGVQLPEIVTAIAGKATVIAGIIAALVSQLTVDYSALSTKKVMAKIADVTKKKYPPKPWIN